MLVAIAAMCVFNCDAQTMVKDTLVLVTSSVRAKTQPISTGKYVKLSSKREGELVYRSASKNSKTGHYSYFVIRPDKEGNPRKIYLKKEQVDAFIAQFGEK